MNWIDHPSPSDRWQANEKPGFSSVGVFVRSWVLNDLRFGLRGGKTPLHGRRHQGTARRVREKRRIPGHLRMQGREQVPEILGWYGRDFRALRLGADRHQGRTEV